MLDNGQLNFGGLNTGQLNLGVLNSGRLTGALQNGGCCRVGIGPVSAPN